MCAALYIFLSVALAAGPSLLAPSDAQEAARTEVSPMPASHFDRNRDASADLMAAVAEAHRTGRRVLVDVGGPWCMYCAQMDTFFQTHPDLLELRDQRFVTVLVFYGEGEKNDKALGGLPAVEGIPHFYVLGEDGKLLRSQHVVELRESGNYSAGKMKRFLEEWAPPRAGNSALSKPVRLGH
jgi:thioredoxin-related protein